MGPFRKCRNGFSLLEILVALAIIAILSTIAIMNYLAALERGKQRRTMADMRTIAGAWEARAVETRSYNAGGFTFPDAGFSHPQLSTMLTPTYTRTLPRFDGWNRPFDFASDQPEGGPSATIYAIRSAGSDQVFNTDEYVQGPFTEYDCDIVYSSGTFVTYPKDR